MLEGAHELHAPLAGALEIPVPAPIAVSIMGSLHLVCPHCESINRVTAERLDAGPKCGRCHHALFNGRAIELGADNFHRHLEHNEVPLVVDFWAPWCGPCKIMAPQYADAAKELEPRARLAKLNTESAPQIAGQFAIRSIPTMMLFKSGREVARHSGAIGKSDIVNWVRTHA
jgi:thioredoxin 2